MNMFINSSANIDLNADFADSVCDVPELDSQSPPYVDFINVNTFL